MPWGAKTVEQSRAAFVDEVRKGEKSKSQICREYGISRPTGDKWLKRESDNEKLKDHSRAPIRRPQKTDRETEERILEVRAQHPAWGARKIKRVLENQGVAGLPAISTMCEILKRNGCVSKEASRGATPYKRFEKEEPNEMWQTDFKGYITMRNGSRCYPLTVLDDRSRYSICVDAKENEKGEGVTESFIRLFKEYGLPNDILCDNGNPWGTSQGTGYTRFEIMLMNLRILPIHGRPRHPQTQGKEERFHSTMVKELLKYTTIMDYEDAQMQFDQFRHCYNHERPHGALGMDVPAKHYRSSERKYTGKTCDWIYPNGYTLRKVSSKGYISYHNHGFFLGEAFDSLYVALRDSSSDADCVNLYYRDFMIARLNMDERIYVSRKIRRVEEADSGVPAYDSRQP